MENFLRAVERCLAANNWYGALFIALTLPDICGKFASPGEKSSQRYRDWFDKYVGPRYGSSNQKWLKGNEAYALRCAFLHEGSDDTSGHPAHDLVSKFTFIEPLGNGNSIHNNYGVFANRTVLQLQVDVFCRDITDGVKQWLKDSQSDAHIQKSLSELLNIYNSQGRMIF